MTVANSNGMRQVLPQFFSELFHACAGIVKQFEVRRALQQFWGRTPAHHRVCGWSMLCGEVFVTFFVEEQIKIVAAFQI